MSSAASRLLARLIRERDALLEAADQDATDPLPPVGTDPDAGALCPSRVESLWCGWQSNGTAERDRLHAEALAELATSPLVTTAARVMRAALSAHRALADALRNGGAPEMVRHGQRLGAMQDILPAVEAALARPAGNAPAAAAGRTLSRSERDIISLCQSKTITGEKIAKRIGLSYDHVRRLLARLVREGRLQKSANGYHAV